MKNNSVSLPFLASLFALSLAVNSHAAQSSPETDWPQWRGPSRNGVATSSPRLLDAWPKDGPKLLWKSEPIPSGVLGGCGSVTVAGEKAFVFVHRRATPEEFQPLGQFHSAAATCVSPTIANGKLYLRQTDAVACWDIADDNATTKSPASAPAAVPTTQADLTAASGRPMTDGFIQEYLIGEIRPLKDRQDFEADDLDKSLRPKPGEKWKVYRKANGQFDLKILDPDKTSLLAHAGVYVHSQSDCRVQLIIGSASRTKGIQVVVNGKKIEIADPANGNRGMQFPDRLKGVELTAGWNLIMLGLIRENYPAKDWTLYMAVRDETGTAAPAGLRYSAEPPSKE